MKASVFVAAATLFAAFVAVTATDQAQPSPPAGSSGSRKRGVHQPKSKYTGRKAQLKSRQDDICPSGWGACPIPGTGEIECFDFLADIDACGGCPASGIGQTCRDIPKSSSVSCQVTGQTASCVVHSCKNGFVPSSGGKSCVAA